MKSGNVNMLTMLENLRAHSCLACGIDVASVAMSCKGKVRRFATRIHIGLCVSCRIAKRAKELQSFRLGSTSARFAKRPSEWSVSGWVYIMNKLDQGLFQS